jgi:Family of unknown function (DUF6459)
MTAVLPELPVTPAWPRLRTLAVPDTEPAPDAEPYVGPALGAQLAGHPTLALGDPPAPLERAADRLEATDRLGLPDPEVWSRRMAQAVAEVLCGVRPVAQLARWTSRDVYESLRRRGSRTATRAVPDRRAVVRSVRVGLPTPGVVEACAVVVARGRVQAVALRLEGADGRWRMTALELG